MYTDYTEENNNDYYADDDNNNNSFNKEKIKKIAFIVLGFVIVVILFIVMAKACTKSTKKNNVQPETSYVKKPVVQIKNKLPLEEKESAYLPALVLYIDEEDPQLTWYSDNTNVAVVSPDGKVTAVGEGTTKIYAEYESDADGQKYVGQCEVTVENKEKTDDNTDDNTDEKTDKLEKISFVSEEISLQVGKNIMLELEYEPENANTDGLIFRSSDNSIAEVDETGIVNGIAVGTVTITVRDSKKELSASIIVNVIEDETDVKPVQLVVYGLEEGLVVGKTSKIKAEVKPDSASNAKLTWTTTNPNVATVDEDGNVTGVSPGKCVIMATTENGISQTCDIIVESDSIPVESVTISGSNSISLEVGGRQKIEYTISPDNATNKNVTFKSSDEDKLMVISDGTMLALKEGFVTVTLTTEDGSKQQIIAININKTSGGGASDNNNDNGNDDSDNNGGNNDDSNNGNDSNNDNSNDNNDNNNNDSDNGNDGSGGSGGSDGGSSNSCSADSIIIEGYTNGGTKGTVSNQGFTNAENNKFKKNGGMKVTEFNNCIDKVTYSLEFGTNKSSMGNPTTGTFATGLGDIISFSKGNGYYHYTITVKDKDGKEYKKDYYAVLTESDGSSVSGKDDGYLNVSITKNSQSCSINLSPSGLAILGGLKYYYYNAIDLNTCYDNVQTTKNTSTKKTQTLSLGILNAKYMCFQGISRNYSVKVCKITKNGSSVKCECGSKSQFDSSSNSNNTGTLSITSNEYEYKDKNLKIYYKAKTSSSCSIKKVYSCVAKNETTCKNDKQVDNPHSISNTSLSNVSSYVTRTTNDSTNRYYRLKVEDSCGNTAYSSTTQAIYGKSSTTIGSTGSIKKTKPSISSVTLNYYASTKKLEAKFKVNLGGYSYNELYSRVCCNGKCTPCSRLLNSNGTASRTLYSLNSKPAKCGINIYNSSECKVTPLDTKSLTSSSINSKK